MKAPARSSVFSCPLFMAEPDSRESITDAFAKIPALALQQPWETNEGEPRGWARTARTEDSLLVLADFTDDDVFNPISGFNSPAYQHGDVCEVFIFPEDLGRYVEIHTTPDGSIWQLAFPLGWIEKTRANPASANIEDQYVWTSPSRAQAWLTETGWSVYIAIPFSLIGTSPSLLAKWRMAVCRYDYTRGQEKPVLSTTSKIPKPDFHLPELWTPIDFTPTNTQNPH